MAHLISGYEKLFQRHELRTEDVIEKIFGRLDVEPDSVNILILASLTYNTIFISFDDSPH
jgi:hypothetical protein